MLRVSKLTDYATVIMAYCARVPERRYVTTEVAAAVGVAFPTTRKVLQTLTRGGLLVTTRGPKGGYRLARPVGEISLTEIIKAMEGPLGLTECSVAPGACSLEQDCILRLNWRRINRLFLKVLCEVTLADMASPRLRSMRLVVSRQSPGGPRAATGGVDE